VSGTTITIDEASYRRLLSNLALLPRRVGILVVRKAMFAWGGVVKPVMQAVVKRGPTKALSKSLKVDVVIPDASYNIKHHGKPARVGVGPSTRAIAFSASIGGKEKKLSNRKAREHFAGGGKVRISRPSRYAHLVEKGIAGKGHVAPNPFTAAGQAVGNTAGFAKFQNKLSEGIAAEAAKLPK